ncbi:hypothetical protein TorRG33x02_118790, partial [Trema orientale]
MKPVIDRRGERVEFTSTGSEEDRWPMVTISPEILTVGGSFEELQLRLRCSHGYQTTWDCFVSWRRRAWMGALPKGIAGAGATLVGRSLCDWVSSGTSGEKK